MESQGSQYGVLAEDLRNVETRDVHRKPDIFVFTKPLTSCATGIHLVGAAIQKLFLNTSNHHGDFCLKKQIATVYRLYASNIVVVQ